MRSKVNLSKIGCKIFYQYIYPLVAKEFLLGNDYEVFAQKVSEIFILNSEQWACILAEWETKEYILSE